MKLNRIKRTNEATLSVQATKQLRAADLIEESDDGDTIYRAVPWVYAFDNLLLVIDSNRDRVSKSERAELVSRATRDTESIYQGRDASISDCGNGYRLTLPNAHDAGFRLRDKAPAVPAPNILVYTRVPMPDEGDESSSSRATRPTCRAVDREQIEPVDGPNQEASGTAGQATSLSDGPAGIRYQLATSLAELRRTHITE